MRVLICLVLILSLIELASAQTNSGSPANKLAPQNNVQDQQHDAIAVKDGSENTWKWLASILFTAIVSPLAVKLLEKRFTGDPVKDLAGRLKSLIEIAALQKSHGLPDDPRIRGLIDEQTDKLAGHASGRQEELSAAISAMIADLSVRHCESLFQSCQQLELLLDSKHRSNKFSAVLDLTRLEFLRSAHAIECLNVPPHFRSISKNDFDNYIEYIGKSATPVGDVAKMYASDLDTTPEAVEQFVMQIRETVKSPSVETQAALVLKGITSE
jgi:hypothetical protein